MKRKEIRFCSYCGKKINPYGLKKIYCSEECSKAGIKLKSSLRYNVEIREEDEPLYNKMCEIYDSEELKKGKNWSIYK